MKRFILLSLLMAVLLVSGGTSVHADGGPKFENPLGNDIDTVMDFFEILLNEIIVPIGAVVVAFFIIWSGFLFVTAGGNDEQLSKAKTTFKWTIIGATILLGAWAITEAIQTTVCQIADDPEAIGCNE